MKKKPMEPLTKVKLMLLVEYLIFVAIFLTLGILFVADVIKVADWKRYAFTWVTLFGSVWIISDFVWCIASPKRRARTSMVDKIALLPVGMTLIVFDVYAITLNCSPTLPYRYFIGIDLIYLGAVFLFEAIYHWYRPIPAAIEAALEEEKAKTLPPEEKIEEEKKDEEK